MDQTLRLLIVDDHMPDAELSARQIASAGYPCIWRRVETESAFSNELRQFLPQLILSDFTLPQYDGLSALHLATREAPEVPFIFVSGSLGEARAADALTRGATDYVPKGDRTRLIPAVTRALASRSESACPGTPAERIRRLSGAVNTVSGPCSTVRSMRTRETFLDAACRVVYESAQYEYAFIVLFSPHISSAHVVAWFGAGSSEGINARFPPGRPGANDTSITGRVLHTGHAVLCLDTDEYSGAMSDCERTASTRGASIVSLPLLADNKPIGALTLRIEKPARISEPELRLLEDLANSLSARLTPLPIAGAAAHFF